MFGKLVLPTVPKDETPKFCLFYYPDNADLLQPLWWLKSCIHRAILGKTLPDDRDHKGLQGYVHYLMQMPTSFHKSDGWETFLESMLRI